MGFRLLFWILMLLWLLFGLWVNWPSGGSFRPLGGPVLLFVLLTLLGWKVFGAPVRDDGK